MEIILETNPYVQYIDDKKLQKGPRIEDIRRKNMKKIKMKNENKNEDID